MAVIEGGTIITGNIIEGSARRPYAHTGVPAAPIAGTILAHLVAGDLVEDVDTGNVYEYTTGPEAFTRVDTV